jgi:large subunit ribosomal protein L18
MYTQAVNDENGTVLAAASTLEKDFRAVHKNTKNLAGCEKLGEIMAERLKAKNIDKIVFDRGLSPYHGRVKALAEALRKAGLTF